MKLLTSFLYPQALAQGWLWTDISQMYCGSGSKGLKLYGRDSLSARAPWVQDLHFFTPILSSQLTFFWELLPPPSSGPSWTPFSRLCDSSHWVTPGPAHSGWEPTWAQQTIVLLLTCFLTFREDTWIKKAPSLSFDDVFSNADKEGWLFFGDTNSKMEVLHCYWWSCFLP